MNTYNLSTLLRLSVTFTLADGVTPADPTSVTATVTDPDGVTTNPTAVRDGVGLYHADVTPTVSGTWSYAFVGTGAVIAQGQDQFFVEPSLV